MSDISAEGKLMLEGTCFRFCPEAAGHRLCLELTAAARRPSRLLAAMRSGDGMLDSAVHNLPIAPSSLKISEVGSASSRT
jgi:hypothetical protein